MHIREVEVASHRDVYHYETKLYKICFKLNLYTSLYQTSIL